MIIYSPHDGTVLTDRINYKPRTCFIMTKLGKEAPDELKKIRSSVRFLLKEKKIKEVDASSKINGKDFLLKIWRQILEVPMGIAILYDGMSASTVGNIFYELALMDSLGKETIIIKTTDFKMPSDFVRTEYILFGDNFTKDFKVFLVNVFETAKHYKQMAKLMDANPVLSLDYLKRAFLISGDKKLLKIGGDIFKRGGFDKQSEFAIKNFLSTKYLN